MNARVSVVRKSGASSTHGFNFCISTHPFISKLTEPKLVLIKIRFLKKYFQAYEQSAGKFPLNYIIPGFNHHLSELNLSIKR